MQNISIHMLIDDTQAKNFIIFDVMRIMIHLAWVANSMVIFSASKIRTLARDFARRKIVGNWLPDFRNH